MAERDDTAIREALASSDRYAAWSSAYENGKGRPIDAAQEEVITLAAEVCRLRSLFGAFQLECCDDWSCAQDHARKAGETIAGLRAEVDALRGELGSVTPIFLKSGWTARVDFIRPPFALVSLKHAGVEHRARVDIDKRWFIDPVPMLSGEDRAQIVSAIYDHFSKSPGLPPQVKNGENT